LYLPNLRDNAYTYLIECENIRYGKKKVLVSDTNELDGYPKYKSVTSKLISRFDAAHGGQLVELDIRDKCFNYQNTLTRHKEAYHKRLFEAPREKSAPVEEGIDTIHHASGSFDDSLRDAIIYDWYLKNSFVDHISDEHFNSDSFRHCNFREYGDFANQPFESSMGKNQLTFVRNGGLYNDTKANTKLTKNFSFGADTIDFTITLESESTGKFAYVMEHNFHFSDYETLRINGMPLEENGSIENIQSFEMIDTVLKKKITFRMDKPFNAHYFLLQTLSQSEQGFDLSVQGLSIAFVFDFDTLLSVEGTMEIARV
ncbi:alpha-amylase/4-alpha-glucanotransferase domain-containing protein, partial [Sulfuricurvum sp.]|uniref:alpha-amylase/4-alpha-glucanotransferase domain-containing protein n=1 Tax=Sulfuricurvum sp. TaxID=2025608 RepID=UPI002D5950EF